MHQGSALIPLLFVFVMEAISREFTAALPWALLYADDLVAIAETEDLIKRLNEWKNNVENRGLRVTTTTVLPPFVEDYPGEPVPEGTLTHPPS